MKTVLSLLIFIPLSSFAQIHEDFESGQLTTWTESETGHWAASPEQPLKGNYSLRQTYDRPEAGRDQISFRLGDLSLSAGNTVWQFSIKQGYLPSSANNWAVFLVADCNAGFMKPGTTVNAFVAGVNFNGSDDLLKLWHIKDGKINTVLSTDFNWQTETGTRAASLRIIRDSTGTWEIEIDTTLTYRSFQLLGEISYPDTVPAYYFGISYKYSSSQDCKLWVDDITIDGIFIKDTIPPSLSDYRFIDSNRLALSFSEPVKSGEATFSLDHHLENTTTFLQTAPDSVILYFTEALSEDTIYHLHIQGIKDFPGNQLTGSIRQVSYHLPHYLEIQINEIMADPSPPLGLPEVEYIELYNATDSRIWLDRCIFKFGKKEKYLPLFDMLPHTFSILCSAADIPLLKVYGRVIPVPSMPPLSNDGMALTLFDKYHRTISYITYNPDWYHDLSKSEGGWSLEQMDPDHPCPREENWRAAKSYPGGSPGTKNTVFADNPNFTPAEISNLYFLNDSTLFIRFSESYDPVSASDPNNYQMDHGMEHPASVLLHPPDYLTEQLIFKRSFRKGIYYILSLSKKLTDCSGNHIITANHYQVAHAIPADSLDIVINEILYNPPPDGADFVEIYNRSEKVIDLHSLLLACRDQQTYGLKDIYRISDEPRLLFPGQYRVITPAPAFIQSEFVTLDKHAFIKIDRMPALPDDHGNILLIDKKMSVMDEFHYEDDMQFPLLRKTEGVTLERINYNSPTQDRLNWHSAAADAGYGTPGLQNSQYSAEPGGTNRITTEPEIISPDNDGYHDLLHIHYHFDQGGYVAIVLVFDANGLIIRTLANNLLLGKEGEIVWDGLNSERKKPLSGIYLIYLKVFNLKGEVHTFKRTCVLTWRKG